ncbi:MAG TPA: suppressor of fused domain protein [Frankiaceae bacterium]|nr:suppressor of fused domain protein [Frankiaceae bacterium]
MAIFGRRGRRGSGDEPGDEPGGESAPGWDAVTAALRGLHGDARDWHVAPLLSPLLGGRGYHGCSAFAAGDHWHYVTYGLSALFEPGTGWGIELTLRVPRADEPEPPRWPYAVLSDLVEYVRATGNVILPGEWMETPGAVTGHPANPEAPPTGLTCLAFVVDPRLGRIATPHGEVTFVQAVGITAAERQAMEDDADAVLDALAAGNPLLVTDPARA